MAALLNSHSIGLFGKWFPNFSKVAVVVEFISNLAGIMDKCKKPGPKGPVAHLHLTHRT